MALFRESAHRGVIAYNSEVASRHSRRRIGVSQAAPDLRHVRRLIALITMQNTLAGMKPSWSVLKPMMQTSTLLTPANAHPSQHLRPTRIVDEMVNMQDK
jgi:hypothetical protein